MFNGSLRWGCSGRGPVNDDQSLRIAVAFAREAAKSPEARLCSACVDVLDVTGAGITIMGGGQAGPVCVSNPRMAALEDLQYTIGEGPCQDAFRSNMFVHAPRLDVSASARWPSFVDLAHDERGRRGLRLSAVGEGREDRCAHVVPGRRG